MSAEHDQGSTSKSQARDWTTPSGLEELARLGNWATLGEWYRHQTDLLVGQLSWT